VGQAGCGEPGSSVASAGEVSGEGVFTFLSSLTHRSEWPVSDCVWE
jgi:hypothetical protein